MLVLSRRVSDEIIIDGGIRVVILAIRGKRVRLGVTAPPGVRVDRREVRRRRMEFAQRMSCGAIAAEDA